MAVPITKKLTTKRWAVCLTDGCNARWEGRNAAHVARRHADREDHEVVAKRVQEQRWRKPFAKAATAGAAT